MNEGYRMASVQARVEIARPPHEVYAFVADAHTRRQLLPVNFTGFRLLSEQSGAPGARFAFTIETARGAYESVTEYTEASPPERLVERTSDEDVTYETRWSFVLHGEGTLVTTITEYPAPAGWMGRLTDRLFARRALQQSAQIELEKLKLALTYPPNPLPCEGRGNRVCST
jgi:hypothetical protein